MSGRVPSRYVIIELTSIDGGVNNIIKTSIENEVKSAIYINYGEYGAAMIGQLIKVYDAVPLTSNKAIVVLKVPASHCKECITSMEVSFKGVKIGGGPGRTVPVKLEWLDTVGSIDNVMLI
ncbi:hypothetical protein FOL47_009356 [Perkinsus chesapeaki]|uniref:Uncharacterized protein n=1 Tax=Perkinsus chesapeaki TaxID=330153 RepID=A0A7J6L8S9_PERCH|nr:hypothetical protein FOL47_009356 [Perkinsus chesapeaki]